MNGADHRKEVFAWFGAAAYYAQSFEVELQTLLLLVYRLHHPSAPLSELDEADTPLSKRTIGQLRKELEKHLTVAPEFSAILKVYGDKRNYLMHRYFFENARRLVSQQGCTAIVNELQSLSQTFREADATAQQMSKHLRALAGWSEEEMEAVVGAELRKNTHEEQ
jgi:hypothetical protein